MIWMGSVEVVPSKSTANSATIGLSINRPNGLYHCFSEQSQWLNFSLYLRNSSGKHIYSDDKLSRILLGCEIHIHRLCVNSGHKVHSCICLIT